MAIPIVIEITPVTLTELTIIIESTNGIEVKTLADCSIKATAITLSLETTYNGANLRFYSQGYNVGILENISITNKAITLTPTSDYIKTSDGTNNYYVKDDYSRKFGDDLLDIVMTKADASDIPSTANFVTTDTDQSITGTKTFVGQKKVAFKQSGTSDKLGFTLYNNSGTEKGYLEFNPSNQVDSVPLMTLGNYATAAAGLTHVGFRKYSNISGASGAYNLLTPLISDAKTPFNLTTTYTNFYLPLGFTDGTNTVMTAKTGMVDLSTLTAVTSSDVTSALGYTPVDKAGDTMSGNLNFTTDYSNSDIRQSITLSDVTLGTLPSENYLTGFQTKDSQGYEFANINCSYNTNGRIGGNFYLRRNINGSNINSSLGIYMDTSGNVTTSAPTPSANSNDTNIATTEWVNDATKSTNVVHRDTAETITGQKTFTEYPICERTEYARFALKSTNWTRGTNPSSSSNCGIIIQDGNSDLGSSHRLGEFVTQLSTNGSVYSEMRTYKNVVENTSAYIRVGYNSGGNVYTYAPASEANDSIVTTVAKNKAANGYYKLGNGLIIQWGAHNQIAKDGELAITFPTAFSNTNYSFVECAIINSASGNARSSATIKTGTKTTTGLTLIQDTFLDDGGQWIAIGY